MVLTVLLLSGCTKESERVVRIAGSRSMTSIMENTASSFKKSHNILVDIEEDESLRAFDSLSGGTCDIVNSSIKIPYAQLLEIQRKEGAIKEILVAYDAIVPVVNLSNSINNLFLGQFTDIYGGLLKDWRDVGGSSGKILIVDWLDSSDIRMSMQERFFEAGNRAKGRNIQYSGKGIISYISQHKNSIGYLSKSEYNSKVKLVMINGVRATQENIIKGYYPLYRQILFYLTEQSYKGAVKTYIDFVLSKNGQEILQKAGFIPAALMKKSTD